MEIADLENKCFELDFFDLCRLIPDQAVDHIITDLPYGLTYNKWDSVIDLEKMWEQVKRIKKPGGVFITTAIQPFTSLLVASNYKMFKYEWIWAKNTVTGFLSAKKKPLKEHENILVFCETAPPYHPQGLKLVYEKNDRANRNGKGNYNHVKALTGTVQEIGNYPRSILYFDSVAHDENIHATQKPVNLYEYLILTHTEPGDLILDPCAGSGTTGIAARQNGRRYILGEKDPDIFKAMQARLNKPFTPSMFE